VSASQLKDWVFRRRAPWASAFTSTAQARSKIQGSTCRQLPSPKPNEKKTLDKYCRPKTPTGINVAAFTFFATYRLIFVFRRFLCSLNTISCEDTVAWQPKTNSAQQALRT